MSRKLILDFTNTYVLTKKYGWVKAVRVEHVVGRAQVYLELETAPKHRNYYGKWVLVWDGASVREAYCATAFRQYMTLNTDGYYNRDPPEAVAFEATVALMALLGSKEDRQHV